MEKWQTLKPSWINLINVNVMISDIERKILGEVYSSSEAMLNLTVMCDDYGGRFAGTQENFEAANFMLSKFEEYGFENPHLETFKFKGCKVGPSKLEITSPRKKTIPCLTLPMTASGEAEADIIYVSPNTHPNLNELSGKAVISSVRPPFIRSTETDL
jgi:hypothetical protein